MVPGVPSRGAVAWVVQLDEWPGSIWTRALVVGGRAGRRIVNMGGVLAGNGLLKPISGLVQMDQGSGSKWTNPRPRRRRADPWRGELARDGSRDARRPARKGPGRGAGAQPHGAEGEHGTHPPEAVRGRVGGAVDREAEGSCGRHRDTTRPAVTETARHDGDGAQAEDEPGDQGERGTMRTRHSRALPGPPSVGSDALRVSRPRRPRHRPSTTPGPVRSTIARPRGILPHRGLRASAPGAPTHVPCPMAPRARRSS